MHRYQLRLHPHRAGSTFRYLYRYKYVSRPTAAGWVDLSSIVLAEFAFDCADAMYRIPTAAGGDDDKRRTFPPPRQAVAAVRSRVFRRPGCRRHARSTENTYIIATPEAVAGCPAPHNAPSPPRRIRCQPRTTHHGASVSEPIRVLRVLRVLRDLRLLR